MCESNATHKNKTENVEIGRGTIQFNYFAGSDR